ncbi:MAG: hypothetical protein RL033_6509 [Pseudomonadota bacterium]
MTATEEVADLYRSFECHFARREYSACLPYLERACQLTDSPRCLLNLGAVHHALMHCQLARSYYQQYLDRTPYDEDVSAARSALEELERACPQAAPVTEGLTQRASVPVIVLESRPMEPLPVSGTARGEGVTTRTPPGAPNDAVRAQRGPDHLLAWSLLGAGAASLTGTVVAAAYGARAERDYEARARAMDAPARASDAELRAIDDRGHRYNQLALVLGVLSGALTGAGATLWLTEGVSEGSSSESAAGAQLEVAPDGTAKLSYSGSF